MASPLSIICFLCRAASFFSEELYSREIVEPKLRELQPDDVQLSELQSAFKAARRDFSAGHTVPKWGKQASAKSKATEVAPVEKDSTDALDEDFEEIIEEETAEI